MSGYILLDEYSKELSEDIKKGPFIDDTYTKRLVLEKQIKVKGLNFKISVFSKESEPPHFLIEYQGEHCRFDLKTGEHIDNMGTHISSIRRNIKKFYNERRYMLCEIYNDNLPSDAPPQARITF